MRLRQTRDRNRLTRYRILAPGEVDHEIGLEQLVTPPPSAWDAPTIATCAQIYHLYVEPAAGGWIPDAAFCDVPRWVFLEYAVQRRAVLLTGTGDPGLSRLEPVVLSRNLTGWNVPRSFAFANSADAIFRAILDQGRLQTLDCPIKSTMAWRFVEAGAPARWGFYFGIDYRALPCAPWRPGTVYLYSRANFPPDYETAPYLADRPIRPLARLTVYPRDFPLLDRVEGVDVVAQTERQSDTFCGYPWVTDPGIHPQRWQRPIVDEARSYLEANSADPVCLARLGRRAGVSPFALLRMFRAAVGLSPREYQTLIRVARAKRLLRDGKPIAQAAAETGFCDQTHLTRHFRRVVGMTPGRYLRAQESPIRRP
jgi:AraC-like DNA-binding protein